MNKNTEKAPAKCKDGGVSMYISDSFKYTWRHDIPEDDLELICIQI